MRLIRTGHFIYLIFLFSQIGLATNQVLPESKFRWFYLPCNFQDNNSVEKAISLVRTAKQYGYDGVVVADPKFGAMKQRPLYYFTNLKNFIKSADSASIEIIPVVVYVGNSESILQNDPSLAEGIPVKNCVFKVQGRKAVVDDVNNYLNFAKESGSQEEYLKQWDYVDQSNEFVTAQMLGSGQIVIQMKGFQNPKSKGMVRISKKLKIQPFTQYQIDLDIKTVNVVNPGGIRITALGMDKKEPELNYTYLGVKKTQNWTKHSVVINTMANSNIVVWLGCWGVQDGVVYLRNPAFYAVGGINLVRREGCPVKVTNMNGDVCYEEGKDYFRWEYKDLGNNGWMGRYHVTHSQVPIQITSNSAIREGEKIKVSYYHVPVIYNGQVCCCLTHPKTFTCFQDELQNIIKVFQPKRILLNYDEIRVAGQCELCRTKNKTCGELLADHIRKIREMIKTLSPRAEIYVWSDMFDPYHNAVGNYYLAASTFKNSWLGLEDDMKILNWNYPKRKKSLRFFHDLGMCQVISCNVDVNNYETIVRDWTTSANFTQTLCLDGFMYTTWQGDYEKMSHYQDILADSVGKE